jgi:DNA-binding NtrC family response regulator
MSPRTIELVIIMVNCLLIDRNETSRTQVSGMLAELGIACTRKDAWSEYRPLPGNRFDFVIIGNPVPADYRHVPTASRHAMQPQMFFYFSGHPDVDVISKLIVRGVADVLVMPFDRDILGFKLAQAGVRLLRAA